MRICGDDDDEQLSLHPVGSTTIPDKAVFVTETDLLECIWDDHALHPVIWRRDAFISLEPSQSGGAALGLVRDHASDGPPEDLCGSTEVDGTVGGLRVHALPQEAEVLHLLPYEAARQADLLASNHHYLLPVQQLLRHDRCQAPKHVVAGVHHHTTSADARTRHHLPLSPTQEEKTEDEEEFIFDPFCWIRI
ncbi:hypothetical protein CKAN_00693800 [Cinnamomum micranthum f. kanehirae]|uniref:Uncharacterized protein n=1 Tax=Cinnamomum micranthum f. kanehirae TaxID=337451 RepID=A0A443NIP8_9MAGN|nr:hypothetical protein CKAN_00693800 [Cinnamomum micranthum f. kanehirae]